MATERGYTGHEHLDEMTLIHMNGRIYDPALGRFMTPDPFIQNPNNLQSYNRYTYGFNNPMSGTDASGYIWGWIAAAFIGAEVGKQLGIIDGGTARAIQGIAVGAAFGLPGGFQLAGSSVFGNALIGGFAGGLVGGGSIESGMQGAFSAGLFFGVGRFFPGAPGSMGKIFGHAIAGCLAGAARNSGCGVGAFSAGFSEFAGPRMGHWGSAAANMIKHAVIGGTASVIGGGKFGNGATTAAFGYLFNHLSTTYANEQDAIRAHQRGAYRATQSAPTDGEDASGTYQTYDGRYANVPVYRSPDPDSVHLPSFFRHTESFGIDTSAMIQISHTHGIAGTLVAPSNEGPSEGDTTAASRHLTDSYFRRGGLVHSVITPSGRVFTYDGKPNWRLENYTVNQ